MSGTSFDEFLAAAEAGGSPIALRVVDELSAGLPVSTRRVDGATMTTLPGVYAELARAWGFPDHFGANKDAFDDCMRDLHGSPLVTDVAEAQHLLTDQPRQLRWFAGSVQFYADYYRELNPPVAFAVVLNVPSGAFTAVRRRWRGVGADPILVADVD